jgi:formylglycine-generating enzyme required for sulfatase activity
MIVDREALLQAGAAGRRGEAAEFVVAADRWLETGELELAASALDRAHGLAPDDLAIARQRSDLLERFTVHEHGLVFRYVPAGTFLMGSTRGDPDERPVHPVALDAFWIGDRPITWAEYCDLMGWKPPPDSHPPEHETAAADEERMDRFHLWEANKIRRSYCWGDEPRTHTHAWWQDDEDDIDDVDADAADMWSAGDDPAVRRPPGFDAKPMVAVGWADAELLAERLTTPRVRYALPSEAQWEKAARGGLIGARYSWGDEAPTLERCDFGHFGRFLLAPPRSLPANGYGLHGMCGGVWEWTATLYDALAYAQRAAGRLAEGTLEARPDARLLGSGQRGRQRADARLVEAPHLRVLRGGSWADAASAVTVSIRMAREGWGWTSGQWSGSDTPNVGFRLMRVPLVDGPKAT